MELGRTSLFDFLHGELHLSKGAAFYRKTAVDLVQRFPEIIEPLRDGRLCLTTVAEVGRVLTPENRGEVLPRFFRLSKREAQTLAAELAPTAAPPLKDIVAPIRPPEAAPTLALHAAAVDLGQLVQPGEPAAAASPMQVTVAAAPVKRSATTEPLTAEQSRVHFTASREFLKKLDAARDALSHSHPNAGIEEILEAGLDLLLERHAKRKGLVKRPRAVPPPSSDSDHVPAHVRRAVWERDGGKCQFRMSNGEICESTHQLEIDHVIPRAAGGPSNVDNCRLACRPHNQLAARRFFGDVWMDRYTRGGRRVSPDTVIPSASR